jgi:arginine decarboxylase
MGKAIERTSTDPESVRHWKTIDAVETYGIRNWGKGYFNISKQGHVTIHPSKRADESIDLKQLVDDLRDRDYGLPILIRFTDILRHRVGEIATAATRTTTATTAASTRSK